MLEQALQENTVAIRDLIKALANIGLPLIPASPVAAARTLDDIPAAVEAPDTITPEAKVEAAKVIETAQTAAAYAEQKAITTEPPAPVTYQDAATAITNLAKSKGKPAAIAVLAKLNASKLPDVKPEDFPKVIALVQEEVGA